MKHSFFGEIAYAEYEKTYKTQEKAHMESTGKTTVSLFTPWDKLPDYIREAWHAAAKAVWDAALEKASDSGSDEHFPQQFRV